MSSEELAPIVIDNGSGTIKAGYAGDDSPRTIFPTVVGIPRHNTPSSQDYYIGSDTEGVECVRKHPIEHGIIRDWHLMEKIWHHTFYHELRVSPEDHLVLLTEPPMNPKPNREKLTQIMFEVFNVQGMYLGMSAVLALYATGRTTGVAVDSGEGMTYSVPIYEGYSLPHAITRLELGGRDLTDYLMKILFERGYSFTNKKFICSLKEKYCYIDLTEGKEIIEESFRAPDGQIITIGKERFMCTEPLFNPALVALESHNLPETVHNSVMKVDICIRKDMFRNIILCGGNTMFPGFLERLEKEINNIIDYDSYSYAKIFVNDIKTRLEVCWIGGSILGSLTTCWNSLWISKEEYDECGPAIVHKRCFS